MEETNLAKELKTNSAIYKNNYASHKNHAIGAALISCLSFAYTYNTGSPLATGVFFLTGVYAAMNALWMDESNQCHLMCESRLEAIAERRKS